MSSPLPVAVIGAGHMGRHHVRKYAELPGTRLVAVIDADVERARALAEPLGAKWAAEYSPQLGELAAVTVAVPTTHHLPVARPLIERGIAVLIEKPLAPTVAEAEEIAALAKHHDVVVGVGHTERFNPAVQAVQRLQLRPKFIETHRISPFPFRSADVSVVFDIMIHDIDIVLHLMGRHDARSVDAYGVSVLAPSEDIANARVIFDDGAIANLTASRLALKTERKLRVFCHNAYVSLDYQKKTGIAITLDKNLDIIKIAREKGIADLSEMAGMDFGKLVQVEPLQIVERDALNAELEAFVDAVREHRAPPVSVQDGVAAVRLASQIIDSVRSHSWGGAVGGQ